MLKHVRSVRCGDLALICHAGEQRALVGITEVIRNSCPDPKNKDARIVIINVASGEKLAKPVGLEESSGTLRSRPLTWHGCRAFH